MTKRFIRKVIVTEAGGYILYASARTFTIHGRIHDRAVVEFTTKLDQSRSPGAEQRPFSFMADAEGLKTLGEALIEASQKLEEAQAST